MEGQLRRAPSSLGVGSFAGRLAIAVLLAAAACVAAEGYLTSTLTSRSGYQELTRRTVIAAAAASTSAKNNSITPLTTRSVIDDALQSLAADPEVNSINVLGADGSVLSVVRPEPVPEPADAVVDRAADVSIALLSHHPVTRVTPGRWTVTAPLHDAGSAAALQVRWSSPAMLARARAVDRIAWTALSMGAAVLVPLVFAAGAWPLVRRYRHVLSQSRTDEATSLMLRSVFHHDLARLCAHGPRGGEQLVLGLIDLNGLTMVNDSYGRRRGESLIAAIGTTLRRYAGDPDTPISGAYRISGDCFAVIMHVATTEDAMALGDRIRRQLAVDGEPMTANLGLAPLDGNRCVDAETMFVAADAAMHEARLMGGNRVVTSGTASSGLRWEVSSGATDDLLHALQEEIDGFNLRDSGDGPSSLDLRDYI